MVVTRDMLQHTHYRWDAGDALSAELRPNEWERLFVPSRGAEVLAVLQKAADALHVDNAAHVRRLETLLVHELPKASMSRHDAFMWLYVEFKKRSYGS
jgi:hypothetical protein